MCARVPGMCKKTKWIKESEMEITKGQEFSLEIDDMGTDGEGIGHKEGYTLFVKDALVGDIVRVKVIKAKKKFGYGRLLEVMKPSPWRVEPACDCARQCGGCQIQHCSYEKQLAWKEKKVRDCLQRIGGFEEIPMEPIKATNSLKTGAISLSQQGTISCGI